MSKSNILKQSDVQKENMYEYFIVINNNDSIPGKFFAFSNEKISINTVNKMRHLMLLSQGPPGIQL